MADNYLENKMEEHRAGRGRSSVAYRQPRTPAGNRPGEWIVKFTPCDILLTSECNEEALSLIRLLAGIGFRVYFRHPDIHQGQKLARTLNARFLPPGIEAPADTIHIILSPSTFLVRLREAEIEIDAGSDFALQTITWTAVFLANHKDFDKNMLRNIKISGETL